MLCMALLYIITRVVALLILQEIRLVSGYSDIKATLFASGWPPATVKVSWTSQIREAAQYDLFYNKTNDYGCPSITGMVRARWCRRNSLKFVPNGKFQCDITEAYTKLRIFKSHSYYNLCVIIVANTSSGQQYYSNKVVEDLAQRTQCPPPQNLTLHSGKRNISVEWKCPAGVSQNICDLCIAYKVLLTKIINGSDQCVNEPLALEVEHKAMFTGLQPNTMYKLTVCCSLGCFVPSKDSCDCNFMGPPLSSQTVITKEDAPGASPKLSSCHAKCLNKDMTVDLTYRAPSNSAWYGTPVNYRVTYRRLSLHLNTRNTTKTFGFDGQQTTLTLVGLYKTAKYRIETSLCTLAGCGPVTKSTIACEECGGVLPIPTTNTTQVSTDVWSKLNLGIVIAAGVFLLAAIPTAILCWISKRTKGESLKQFNVDVSDPTYQPKEQDSSESNDYDELAASLPMI